ncbi:hypothetical protein N7474_000342 [Penicillium riverlandense]|uniref:uncharacterized protein n=1 Tax=Penicillium riverlandense TaxID=1903569 RepID=UPI002547C4D1|nr:uncharacterized protein N7474_000342 [Penicillium riverlandense]KAJ5832031.1 hypothetical protein N7474_000342 [Penicillium riverlandense]
MSQLEALQNQDLAEEIDAINAIYEPDTVTVSHTATTAATNHTIVDLGNAGSPDDDHAHTATVILQIPGQPHLSFVLGFSASYPETRPVVLGTASTAARGEGKIAVVVLEDIVQRTWQPGAVCLFDVISEATERFPDLNIGGSKDDGAGDAIAADEPASAQTTTTGESATTIPTEAFATLSLRDTFGLDSPPAWILSDVVTEKKSVFLGRAARVESLEQAQAFLDHLTATDRKVAAATHNISAWRIRHKKAGAPNGESETVVQDYDDDGETAAGGRLLHVMQLMDVWNVVVVVTRWYGGIHLGPARFRLINDVGRDALVKAGFTKEDNAPAGSAEKSKKKSKK